MDEINYNIMTVYGPSPILASNLGHNIVFFSLDERNKQAGATDQILMVPRGKTPCRNSYIYGCVFESPNQDVTRTAWYCTRNEAWDTALNELKQYDKYGHVTQVILITGQIID